MKEKIIIWLTAVSFLLHTSWELIQTEWVVNLQGKPWYIIIRNCSVGITLDILYTLGIYYLFAFYKNSKEWVLNAGVKDYVIIFIFSILSAFSYEWMGWKLDLWSFSESMPHLPEFFGKIPLSPLIQLPVLVSATFFITQRILSSSKSQI